MSTIINKRLELGVDAINGASSSSRCNIFGKKSLLYATDVILGHSEKNMKSAQERGLKSYKKNQVSMAIISHD